MRTLKYTGAAAALLLLAALALGMGLLRASLPRLDGALAEVGLTSAVRIARDSRGVRARRERRARRSRRTAVGVLGAGAAPAPVAPGGHDPHRARHVVGSAGEWPAARDAAAGNQRAARRRAVRRALEVRPQLPLPARDQLGCAGGACLRAR